jgi:cytochrome c553
MRHARVLGLSSLAILAVGALAHAQTSVTALPDNAPVQAQPLEIDLAKTRWGDAKAGAAKAATCAACHGADGNPAAPIYPRLAGQGERYTAQQLALFATGQRSTGMAAVMLPFAQALSAQDMRDVGAYFATQKAGAGVADDSAITEGPYKGMKFYEAGQQIFRAGDARRGIPACMSCHGPSGAGNPGPPYPHIGGQPQEYIARRLQEYQAGTTTYKDPAHFQIMAQVAKPLTEQEIQSLGSYIQGLHDRSADAAAAKAGTAPAPAAAPAEPAPAPEPTQQS